MSINTIVEDIMACYPDLNLSPQEIEAQIEACLIKSRFGLPDYDLSISYCATTAAVMGLPFNDLNKALACMIDFGDDPGEGNFKAGEKRGVSFKAFLTHLSGTLIRPTMDSIDYLGEPWLSRSVIDNHPFLDEMRCLGIIANEDKNNPFFTATGKLKPLAEIVAILRQATRNFPDPDLYRSCAKMFTFHGVHAAVNLIKYYPV